MPDIKETLIDLLTGYSLDTYEDVQYVADELIAKGVLPVVRCKDCIMHIYGDNVDYICGRTGACVRFEDFCSCGERKEAEGDG